MDGKPLDLHRSMLVVKVMFGLWSLLSAVLLGGLYIDGQGRDDAIEKLENVQQEIVEARTTARVSSCQGLAEFQASHNDLVRRNQALLQNVGQGATSPEAQAFLVAEIAAYEANIVPVRDCSPEGIIAFSEGTGGYLP